MVSWRSFALAVMSGGQLIVKFFTPVAEANSWRSVRRAVFSEEWRGALRGVYQRSARIGCGPRQEKGDAMLC